MGGKPEFQRGLEAIEQLIARIEGAGDPALQNVARELVEAVLALHGTALERLLEMLREGGEPGLEWIDKLGRDELISGLLVLYNLHPVSMELRIGRAIEKIRPSLQKRGGDVDLLSIADGVPRLRLAANSHAGALKELVEDAIYRAAPDVRLVVIEGPQERAGFVPLQSLIGVSGPHAVNGHIQTGSGNGAL
jgi:Fe-S cluster biogenesis protein NfuA